MNDLDEALISTLDHVRRDVAMVTSENPASGLLRNLAPTRA